MVDIVVVHRIAAGAGVIRYILQVPPLANVSLHRGRHVVVVAGPTASGGRRFERGTRTVDYALATHHLLLVKIGRETVRGLHAKGAEIVLIVF